MLDVVIIGGGLSGLSLALALNEGKQQFAVYEARDRFGGRIQSHAVNENYRVDLGAGWVWPDFQPRLLKFLQSNNIEFFEQWQQGSSLYQTSREEPPRAYQDQGGYAAARRVQGGTIRLVETLLEKIPADSLYLNYHLLAVTDQHDHVELTFREGDATHTVSARRVVITAPPRVVAETIAFSPALDPQLVECLQSVPTWMAGHAKAVIRYQRPFWREKGLSGNALASYPGAVMAEIFDACSDDMKDIALAGFFALPGDLRREYRNDLEALILDQLMRLFGDEAAQAEEVIIKDWFDERHTATKTDMDIPTAHPEYGHRWLQLDHWNDKLYFSGTETASEFGGYLEGALASTERVMRSLLS